MGPRAGREHLHHVLGRLPRRRPVEPRRGAALPGRRQRPGQLGLAVRQGPVRLRGGRQPTSGWPRRWCATGDELVATSWTGALDAAADADPRGARRRRPAGIGVHRRRPRHQRGRVRLGEARRRVIGTDNVDAQLGDGLPAESCSALPRATIDEACAAPARRAARRRTSRRSCPSCTCGCATPSRSSARESSSSSRSTTGLTPLRLAASLRYEPGEQAALVRVTARRRPTADGVEPDWLAPSPTSSSSSAGRRWPSRADRAATPRPSPPTRCAVPRAAPRQRARRARHGPRPALLPGRSSLDAGRAVRRWRPCRRRGLDAAGDPRAPPPTASIDCLVLLGADPLADFPDADLAARALAGARRSIAVDTFLTESSQHADVVLAGRRLRREGAAPPPTSRAASARVAPEGHAAGHRPARLDDRRRARRAARRATSALASVDDDHRPRSPATSPALRRRRRVDRAAPAGRDGVARRAGDVRRPPATARSTPARRRRPPDSYDYPARGRRRKLYDRGRRHRDARRRCAGLAAAARRCTSTRSTSTASASPSGERRSSSSRPTASIVLPVVADAGVPRGAPCGRRSTSPGAAVAELIDATAPVTDVRVETS